MHRARYSPHTPQDEAKGNPMHITGHLLDATRVPLIGTDGDYVIAGDIYHDADHRWPDGRRIRTSRVISERGNIIRTLNSVYLVRNWKRDCVDDKHRKAAV